MASTYPFRLSLFLLILSLNVKAQYFEKVYGNNDQTNGVYFSTTSDHGVVVIGNFLDSVYHTSGYYVLKTDSLGNEVWHKTFSDLYSAYSYSITTLGNEKIVFLGTHAGVVYQNVAEVFVLDSSGNFLSSALYPPFNGWGTAGVGLSEFGDSSISITLYNDGFVSNNYYSVFTLNSDLSIDWSDFIGFDGSYTNAHGISASENQSVYTIAYYDSYFYSAIAKFKVTGLRKHNTAGTLLLDSLYEFNCPTTAITATNDGGAILCGIQDTAFQRDMVLIKLDSSGNILWQRQYGGFFDEESNAVIQTSDSGFVLLATIADAVVPGQHDILLVKTNSNGDSLWARRFGGILDERALHIKEDNNDLIILGSTTSFGDDHIYIVRTDSMGIIQSPYTIVPSGRFFCENDTATLQITPPPSGAHFVWSNGDTINPCLITQSGNYFATITDSLGNSFQTPYVPIYFTEIPDASFGPDTISLCNFSPLVDTNFSELTNSYQWFYNGSPIQGETNYYYTPHQTGTYQLIVRNFCTSDTSISYVDTLYPLPAQPIITSPLVDYVCTGDSLPISVSNVVGETFQWYSSDDFNYYIIPGYTDTTYYVHSNGVYLVSAENVNGCSIFSAPYTVPYDMNVENVNPNGPTTFCYGGEVLLSISPGTNFLWSTGDSTETITAYNSGNYFASFINIYGCQKNSDTLAITVFSIPSVFIGNDTNLCSGSTLHLDAGAGYTNYFWSNGSTSQTFNAGPVGPMPDTNFVTVYVVDTNDCTNGDTLLAIFDVCAGIADSKLNPIILYPNPAAVGSDILVLNENNQSCTLIITDVLNREIVRQSITNSEVILESHRLPSGIYLYSVLMQNRKMHSGRLIVQ